MEVGSRAGANDMKLLIHIDGATELEVSRGIAAAQKIFDEGGATAYEAAAARLKRDGEQDDLTEREGQIAHLWEDADYGAAQACCAGWAQIPPSACLELKWK
jgi:hypothetical protein